MQLRTHILNRLVRVLMTGWDAGSPAQQRARQEKSARYTQLPAHIHTEVMTVGKVSATWFKPADTAAGAVLYLHGGGYVLGSINVYRDLLARLATATRRPALALAYRLAPEHPYPAALDDAVAAYRWLLDQGYPAAQLLIAGDSAGGGLTLATLLALRAAGIPLPAAAVCLSPWTDLALTGASLQTHAARDPILSPRSLAQFASHYAGAHARTDPLISPLYADLQGLPPLLIQVGAAEILLDDARRCAAQARAAGVTVTLEVWAGMCHVFQLFAFLPETRQALQHIAAFAAQYIAGPSPPDGRPTTRPQR